MAQKQTTHKLGRQCGKFHSFLNTSSRSLPLEWASSSSISLALFSLPISISEFFVFQLVSRTLREAFRSFREVFDALTRYGLHCLGIATC